MRIAAVSDDGVTISQHFGRAPFYVVLTIENGLVTQRERREKMGHAQFAGEPQNEQAHDADPRGHGFDNAAQSRHARMASAIHDCDALLAGGMGAGAYESFMQAGIRPVVTDINSIDEAVHAYLEGCLTNHTEWLH